MTCFNKGKSMRINNYISESGFCSRREADQYIKDKRVFINGIVAELGQQVEECDEVKVDNEIISSLKSYITIAYHKPKGITSTTDLKDKTNIIQAINYKERIFPIGRLDKDSEGLILLTSDGQSVNKILRAENNHEKEYRVTLNKTYTNDFLKQMSEGVEIYNPVQDTKVITKPCTLKRIDDKTFSITLTQGYNRQIRRMSQACGYKVIRLVRVRIMNIHLKGLKKGEYRLLTDKELSELNQQLK